MTEEGMEEELIEHTVEIDKYMTAIIKIPKTLSAIDLKALMFKANKLFNLSEVAISEKKVTRTYIKKDVKFKLVERYDKASDEEKRKMANEMGISPKGLYQKVWKYKKDSGIGVPTERRNLVKDKYNEIVKQVAESHLKTKEPIGKLLRDILGRQPGGTDYINVKKHIETLKGRE